MHKTKQERKAIRKASESHERRAKLKQGKREKGVGSKTEKKKKKIRRREQRGRAVVSFREVSGVERVVRR